MTEEMLGLNNIGAVSLIDFIIGLVELIILSWFFSQVYNRFSTSVSNRPLFSIQFIPFAVAIYLIVFTIKSSLVLSLGLVGALSIIRFRTAIKETEQIISLLLLTGVSIAIAANQLILPIIICAVIFSYFFFKSKSSKRNIKENNFLVSTVINFDETSYNSLLNSFRANGLNIVVLNFNESDGLVEIVLRMSSIDFEILKMYKDLIKTYNMSLKELRVY